MIGVIMDSIKLDNKNKPLMIAHRGLSGIKLENTNEAFKLASEHTYFGIETDVHVTKDKKLIVCHDDNILRTSGVDMVIEESLYDDLKKVKLYNGEYLPDLEDYINICKSKSKIAVLELKNSMEDEMIRKCLDTIESLDYIDNTIIISFDPHNIFTVNSMSNVKTQFLCNLSNRLEQYMAIYFARNQKCDVDVNYRNCTKFFVDECHKSGVKVNVYTVDSIEDANEMIEIGVDFITSNILE
jgi:glycerophosphoryl diester phosphodiesterase